MTPYDDRRISKAPVVSRRNRPDMPTTVFSFTRQAVHCSTDSIHGHCALRYSANEIPDSLDARSIANALVRIWQPRPERWPQRPVLEHLAPHVVCYGNEQNRPHRTGPREISGNFFPFNTGPVRQWPGRRTRAPARRVSPTV